MRPIFTNNARAFLDGAITDTDTEIVVGNGSSFPDPGEGEYFACTLESNDGSREIIYVGSRTNNTFSDVERGQEGTTAQSWSSGDTASHRLTAETYSDFIQNADLASNGGTVPEVDRENVFTEDQKLEKSIASFWFQDDDSTKTTSRGIRFHNGNNETFRIGGCRQGTELYIRDDINSRFVLRDDVDNPGALVGDPQGGPQGIGTFNAEELYDNGRAVAPGLIVESGSNSNGNYVRWENGEQICFFVHNHDAGNVSNQSTDYPAEFLSDDTWTTYQATNRRETTSTDAARKLMREPSRIIEVSSGSSVFTVSHSGDASTDGETVSFEVIAWGFWK